MAPAGDQHSWHLYVVRLGDGAKVRAMSSSSACSRRGIGSAFHYIPLHLQPYWRERYDLKPEQFPHSQHAYERMVSRRCTRA